jgi:hypothetical protein
MNATTYSHHNLHGEAGIRWGAHAARVLAMVARYRKFSLFCRRCPHWRNRKIVWARPPLQRMQSNGQAFKPAREPRTLPRYALTRQAQ